MVTHNCNDALRESILGRGSAPRSPDAAPDLTEGGMDIAEWLSSLGLGRYAATFAVNEITPETLPYLSMRTSRSLGCRWVRGS
jgi:hypothetical protein